MLSLLLVACEPFGPGAGDPVEPVGAGELFVAPELLDFGVLSAGQGETAEAVFTARNVGESELVVAGLHHLVGDEAFSSDADAVVTLQPGEEVDVTVTFAPVADGDFSGQLLPNGSARVDLVGVGEAPRIALDSELVSLANSPLGCEDEAVLGIANDGRETLVVSDIALTGSTDLVLRDEAERVLEPGERTEVGLSFRPTVGGQHAASLTVASNDPEQPTASVSVEGLGYEGGIVDESFAYRPMVDADVLFVVDSAAATVWHLQEGAVRIDQWLHALEVGLVDWHQAIVNHDVSCYATDSPWLGTTSSDPDSELAAAFGSAGQGGTELLELAQTAIERTDAFDCLDGFLREGADLHVVLVSARGESSSADLDDYLDALSSRLVGSELVVSALVGDGGAGCVDGGTASSAAEATVGYLGDLCTGSWETHFDQLASVSRATSEVPYEHELAYAPVVETLDVRVDVEPVHGWTWDEERNVLTVVGDEAFDIGATVELEYVAAVPCSD